MEFKVKSRFMRISPFKARRIADIVRGKDVEDALTTLKFMPQKATFLLEKMLHSAIANAEHSVTPVAPENLVIQKIFVDEGPTLRRFQFRAQGRVYRIRKRTSHITIVLEEKVGVS